MTKIFLALVAVLTIPSIAHAERFILKNPKGAVPARTVETMHFGNDTYVVVEAPKYSQMLASFRSNAEAVSEDLRVGLPTDEVSSASRAWHPEALKYSQLPSQKDGRNVIVAVLDTGADYNHPALKDHIYTNAKEIPGNGIDDDGNGFIDDVHGYDFDKKVGDPMDGDQHGTHCAGIIGATKDNDTDAQGVAPGVKIMPVRVIGDEQVGFLSNAAAGIKYAVDNGAKVLSNSWRVYRSWKSYDPSDANLALLRSAIEYAGQHGAIFVAASGNESVNMDTGFATDPLYPAGFLGMNNLVVVAASEQRGEMAYFSNYGSQYVTVAAPGMDILSTVPGGGWQSMSGTSMATPLIAGSIARGLSAGLSMDKAIDRLEKTSAQSSSWATRVRSGGVIDLTKYLAD